jgi:sugar (pentulose or hexulose) kinase
LIYLGADIGTTSAKCLAVDGNGEILAFAQHPYPLSHPRQGWVEQDPEDYWRGLVDVVAACVKQCRERGRAASEIVALALSTQGDTLIIADDSGQPLAPAISWMDSRAEQQMRELVAETGPSFWYRETGSRLTALSSACRIRWLSETEPELRARVSRFCYVPDFLAQRLCGKWVADLPSASWAALFSPFEQRWSHAVLQVLGVPAESLAAVVDSGTPIGGLTAEAAAALTLEPGTMLTAGAFDQAAAAHGAGATVGGTSVLSCGTAWVLYAVVGGAVVDDREQIPICCHVGASQWGLVQPFTGGAAYDWFHTTFPKGKRGESKQAQPLVFVPHLYGGLSPDWRGESRGSILGLTMAHTWGDVEIAVMRGLACEARRNVEAAQRLCGRILSLRLVGGAGKSDIWPQMISDMLNRPIAVSQQTEAACYGAAKLAAGRVADDWNQEQDARVFTPNAAQAEAENAFYARYVRFYEALAELYASDDKNRVG